MNIAQKIRNRVKDFKEGRRQAYAANRQIRKRARAEYFRAKETAAKTAAREKATKRLQPTSAKLKPFLKKVSKSIDKSKARGVQPTRVIKHYAQPQTKGYNPYEVGEKKGYDPYRVKKTL